MTDVDVSPQSPVENKDNRLGLTKMPYSGDVGKPRTVRIYLSQHGSAYAFDGSGNSRKGVVDAIFMAIRDAVPHSAQLIKYDVTASRPGADADAKVTVILQDASGAKFTGEGIDSDTPVASALAYINALNKLKKFI